jgi:signal transduction histidine kinase/CheY-like chemotaxis protein
MLLRMEEISTALFRIASLDFSEPLVPEQDGSLADGMVAGINMLAEEVQAQLAERDIAGRELERRVNERTAELRASQCRAEEAQARAVLASQIKSRFLANMSHEIRTPMSNVLGMTALALEEGLTGRQREYVEAAHSSAQSLLSIVNDILDISKIEAGKFTIDSVPLSPRREFEAALNPLFIRAREKGLATHLAIADAVPEMFLGDSVRLRQVLVNLVFNALKFTDHGSICVDVGMEDGGDRIHVVVTDTGIGVPPEHVATIFDAFRQGDESTVRTFGGTGLGLAICKDLTRLMGGAIWLESEPRKGSAFHFTVRAPRAAALALADGRGKQAPDDGTAADGRRLRVLVAEDNHVSARLVVRMLERSHCDVVRVEDGRNAVEAAATRSFDLIFMDVQMPGMDGLEAAGHIREEEAKTHGAHVPIWALTANAMTGDDLLCIRAGMDGHLAKPIDRATLSALLAKVRRESAGG